jgi:c-di-GMP-binding flagellar brake protein YcgR
LLARVPWSVSIFDAKANAAGHAASVPSLKGHTRDISATGLALVVPAIRIGERYLTGPDRQLRITLELPSGYIELQAAPVRYERLDNGDADTGYLIGTHINSIDEPDRARLVSYLQTLKG